MNIFDVRFLVHNRSIDAYLLSRDQTANGGKIIWWTHHSYIEKYAKLSSGSQLNIAA
jgi:hypothetical protein